MSMRNPILIFFILTIQTVISFKGYCQEQKYKTECLGLYNEELQKYWPEYSPDLTIDLSSLKLKKSKLKIQGQISCSGHPIVYFMIIKGKIIKEQRKIIINDTVFKSENFEKSKKINIWEGEFKIKTKLEEDEKLFIIAPSYCFTEIEFLSKK